MKKTSNILLLLVFILNLVMIITLYQQNIKLEKYEHLITNMEVKLEDLDDAVEDQIIPLLENKQ